MTYAMKIYDSRYEEKTCYSPKYSKISKDLITELRNMMTNSSFRLKIFTTTNDPDRYIDIHRFTNHLTKQTYFRLSVYTKRKLTISSNQRSFFNIRSSSYFRTEFYTLPLTHTFDFFESHEDDERYEGLLINVTEKFLTIKLGYVPVEWFKGEGE